VTAGVNVITRFWCPTCTEVLEPAMPGPVVCPRCAWRGEAYLLAPRRISESTAETALPDEATCLHHPRKKATAVCAGTGDYICSLCAVEIDGDTYSAEYLNTSGKDKASKAFDRTIPRPDSRILLYMVLIFVPYINFVMLALGFLWIPHAFVLYARAQRLRRESPVFARLMGTGRSVLIMVLLVLYSVGWILAVVGLTVALMDRGR